MPSVRHYRPGDLFAVSQLLEELAQAHRDFYRDPTIGSAAEQRSFRTRMLRNGPANIWVATEGRRVVGVAGLVPHRKYGELDPLVVAAGFRRRGVGQMLVRSVAVEAGRRGWKALTVKPVARNTVAIRTFHALGFRSLGHLELDLALKGTGWFVPQEGPTIAGRRFKS
jgi:GNAT superfamily N-acetyltransferase